MDFPGSQRASDLDRQVGGSASSHPFLEGGGGDPRSGSPELWEPGPAEGREAAAYRVA